MDDQIPLTSNSSIPDHDSDGDGVNARTYPLILSGKYFTVVNSDNNDNIQATCVKCKATIKGNLRATSNYRLHLKRKHPDVLNEYENSKINQNISGRRKLPFKNDNIKLKQTKLDFKVQNDNECQKNFDKNIMNYIVQSMKPLSTVEDPNFVKIFADLPQKLNVMSRRTLGRKIEISQKEITEKLKIIFSSVEYVSTTADIWSTKTRSFLGVTAHWIDKTSLECNSCVLYFNRFRGSHTYDKIAEILFEIQSSFQLRHEQVVSTTTDNGSNFVKAFREFGVTDYVPDFSDDAGEDTVDAAVESPSASDHLYEEVLLPVNVAEDETREGELYLPRHLRCASHTLSLLATTDMNNFIKDSRVSRVHYAAIAKCTLLWNMSRRPKSAEVIKDCLGHQLKYPCPTRWNSLYDSIVQLMRSKSKLNKLFHKLGKNNTFTAIEFEYLEEFIEVLKPIATALDYLQGNNCYYGKLLPTLISIRTRLDRLQGLNLRHFTVIISRLKESLEQRFDKFFQLSPEVKGAILASCYHPSYKMRWLPESITSDERQRIQNLAIHALEANLKKIESMPRSSRSSSSSSKEEDEFIVFANRDSDQPQTSKMELELVSFQNDKTRELTILEKYPNIKNVFIQYNTSLCSSAPVERLFSLAGFIHSPTRGCLSDSTFKNLVFLKGNSSLTD